MKFYKYKSFVNSKITRLQGNRKRGFSLILTLFMISIIGVLIISYFTMSRQEIMMSNHYVEREKAEYAADTAFENAKSLLIGLTSDDKYYVNQAKGSDSKGGQDSRYIFISKWDEATESMIHYPLFAGGSKQNTTLEGMYDPEEEDHKIQVSLSGTNNDVAEEVLSSQWFLENESKFDSYPKTIWLFPNKKDKRMMYTFWVEDMEAFPNLDITKSNQILEDKPVVSRFGIQRDIITKNSNNNEVSDSKKYFIDNRLGNIYNVDLEKNVNIYFPATIPPLVQELSNGNNALYDNIRASKHYQVILEQPAPGLSTKEIYVDFLKANDEGNEPFQNSNFSIYSNLMLTNKSSKFISEGIENRFSVGLKPYLRELSIPFGLDYRDEGKSRFNLNKLIANKDVDSIYQIINNNLPQFLTRKGGFSGDYIKAIAANIIDYADKDSLPTFAATEYRGADSFPLINEIFFILKCEKIETDAGKWIVEISATPYIELWNPSSKTTGTFNLSLDISFLDDRELIFDESTDSKTLFSEVTPSSEADNSLAINLLPNEYKVIGGAENGFGKIKWKFEKPIPTNYSGGDLESIDIKSTNTNKTGFARWGLKLMGTETNSENSDNQAIELDKTTNTHEKGLIMEDILEFKESDSFNYTYEISLRHLKNDEDTGTFSDEITSHYGDNRMTYFSNSSIPSQNYTSVATPFGRNYITTSGLNTFLINSADPTLWGDKGYLSAAVSKPGTDLDLPNLTNNSIIEPALAPWRHSNLGRLFSITELGNIHDPIYWTSTENNSSISDNSKPSSEWGGGNSLRIGRKEHEKFNSKGLKASQLLDLFQVGVTGTNSYFSEKDYELLSGNLPEETTSTSTYKNYLEFWNLLPKTARDSTEANNAPYSDLFSKLEHAESKFKRIYGHLNINSAPSVTEIKTLLNTVFTSDNIVKNESSNSSTSGTQTFFSQANEDNINNRKADINSIANKIIEDRPFYAPSQLADSLSKINPSLDYYSDAISEETFARIFNLSNFSSRHFRIHAVGISLARDGSFSSKIHKVYEIFLNPIRYTSGENSGEIKEIKTELLMKRYR